MCVRHSIFYVCATCCDLDVTISLSETAREKARGNNNDLWGGEDWTYLRIKKKKKRGCISGGILVPCTYTPAR